MEIPRSGFAGAVTCTPSACSRSITLFQLDPSAKAPCTRTTVGRDPSRGYVVMASSSLHLPGHIQSLLGGRCKSVAHHKERDYALMPPSFREDLPTFIWVVQVHILDNAQGGRGWLE